MRPARIRVFDGLRITTEHVEHLQDSLQSSIEDLREAAGLGRVVHGFDVRPEADGAILVAPGLAFDRRRRRLAMDEPRRVDVTLPAGRDEQYVCLDYDRVEDGEVEGRATLVWDSVAVVLRDSPPNAADGALALVKLVRGSPEGGPPFRVEPLDPAADLPGAAPPAAGPAAGPAAPAAPAKDLPVAASEAPPAPPPGASESAGAPAPPAPEAPLGPAPDASVAPAPEAPVAPAPEASVAPAPEAPLGPAPDASVAPAPEAPVAPAPDASVAPAPVPVASAAPAAESSGRAARVRQGVLRLAADLPVPGPLTAFVSAARDLSAAGAAPSPRVALARAAIDAGFAPASLTCSVHLAASVRTSDDATGRVEAVATAEATLEPQVLSQFGLSTARRVTSEREQADGWVASEVSEGAIAVLPLAPAIGDESLRERLAGLRIELQLVPAPSGGADVECSLVWSGAVGEEELKVLEESVKEISWTAAMGWKADA